MKDFKPETVDEFIKTSPEESQAIMVGLKNLIEATVPTAEGGISWNVPIYKYNGILAGFSLAKKLLNMAQGNTTIYHMGFITVT